jgi:hypothetical protein
MEKSLLGLKKWEISQRFGFILLTDVTHWRMVQMKILKGY